MTKSFRAVETRYLIIETSLSNEKPLVLSCLSPQLRSVAGVASYTNRVDYSYTTLVQGNASWYLSIQLPWHQE